MRALATLIAVTTLLGAGVATAAEPPATVAPSIADGSAQRALDAARARWKAAAVRSYSEKVQRLCFCRDIKAVRVTVRGGTLAAATPEGVREFATVPRQFRLVQRAIDDRYVGFTARYGRRGNPVALDFDPISGVADDESTYAFTELRPR